MISMKHLVLASIAASGLLVSHASAGDQFDQYFLKMDTNKDGKISAAEYAAAAKASFEKMDTNKDGKFTAEDGKARHMSRGQAAAVADMAADMLKTAMRMATASSPPKKTPGQRRQGSKKWIPTRMASCRSRSWLPAVPR